MKIFYEAYCYDKSLLATRQDPYSVSYNVDCETLEEAAHHAAYDLESFYKNGWKDYGGAVLMVDGKCVYDAYPNGNVVFHGCEEFEKLLRTEMGL